MADAGPPPPAAPVRERLVALDALRGFDMFWILGADHMAEGLKAASDSRAAAFVAEQLDHAAWEGFTFYDLIFPLFVFIVGISIVLSLERARAAGEWRRALPRILTRTLLLIVFGIIFSGGLRNGLSGVRLLGVLQRIGLCYGATATLFLVLRTRALMAVCAGLLLGYAALLAFVPVRDINLERQQIEAQVAATGKTPQQLFDETSTWVRGGTVDGRNLVHHFDFQHLPGRKYDGLYDPEGILSTLPAIATCLLGVFAGLWLRRHGRAPAEMRRAVIGLLVAGAVALLLGFLWSFQLPIIKRIWSSSYVLYAAGWSAILLAIFFQVIDVWGYRRWATPFIWIGMNPIAIYLARNFCDFNALAERLVGGPVKGAFGAYGPLLVTAVAMGLSVLLVWYLQKRRIFLRL
jgi:predicted acyltransferase